MAAARAGRAIPYDAVLAHCRDAVASNDVTVIEGIGGTMVPLDARHTVRDLIAALDIPAVVVSGSYLGALSHTLTAVQSLAALDIRVAGVVVSESETSPVPIAGNRRLPDAIPRGHRRSCRCHASTPARARGSACRT